MLRFSNNQLSKFGELAQQISVAEVIGALAECFAHFAGQPEDEQRAIVNAGIAAARSYGFVSEQHIWRYLGVMVAHGAAFDQLPAVQQILGDPSMSLAVQLALVELHFDAAVEANPRSFDSV